MAVLSRQEQIRLLRKLASLSKQKDLTSSLESIVGDYIEQGQISPETLGFKSVRDMRKFPEFLRKYIKGYVAKELELLVKKLQRGEEAGRVFAQSPLFDKDISSIVALSLKANKFFDVVSELYFLIKDETKFLSEINKILMTPSVVLIFIWVFIAIVSLKTIPSFAKQLGGIQGLPEFPKTVYLLFGKHCYNLIIGFFVTLLLIFFAFKDRNWKIKLIPAFKTLEKFRFTTAFRTLFNIAPSLKELNNLILEANFSKKWEEALKQINKAISEGYNPVVSYSILKKRKLFKPSEFTYLEIALIDNDMSALKDLEDELKIDVENSLEKSKMIINILSLLLGAGLIGGMYIGIIISLLMKMQHSF
jgi:type II secretory pathway component PulF